MLDSYDSLCYNEFNTNTEGDLMKDLKQYISFAKTDLKNGESLNKLVEKIYYLMRVRGHKVSKKTIRESFSWDKLEWELRG